MITFPEGKTVYFDVDDTLVLWDQPIDETSFLFNLTGNPKYGVWLKPNTNITNKVKIFKQCGYCVVVWSQSGPEWAEGIVKQLGLVDYVDLVIAKPFYHYDDRPCTEWMGNYRFPHTKKEDK